MPDWVRCCPLAYRGRAYALPSNRSLLIAHACASATRRSGCSQLLSQMYVISRISVVKYKVLCKQLLQQACGVAVDEAKMAKLIGDGKLDEDEQKGVVASLHFILTSSARYDVPEETLALELQQLGLPKEHAEALVAVFRDGRTQMQQHLAERSLRLPRLEALRWRVIEDPGPAEAHATELQLTLRAQPAPGESEPPPARMVQFRMTADDTTLLHSELLKARELLPAQNKK